jgi:asparagine synthase (glutamine-hydrolysing)
MSGLFLFFAAMGRSRVTSDLPQRFDEASARNKLPPLHWVVSGKWAAALGPDSTGLGTGPFLLRTRRFVIVGNVRLDNRVEVAKWSDTSGDLVGKSDIELIAAAMDERGTNCIGDLIGDFALVAWDSFTGGLTAARDAFGVKSLYSAPFTDGIAASSHAALLTTHDHYDRQFLGHFLVSGYSRSDRTVFDGVLAVPPGALITRRGSTVEQQRFWSAADLMATGSRAATYEEYAEEFRRLLHEAVRVRMDDRPDVWSQLSGGLDSSSVVCTAQSLASRGIAQHPLAGTVSLVETIGGGDEREYSNEVVRQYGLRNVLIENHWAWEDDGQTPPLTDQPEERYPFYVRDGRMASAVHSSGGKILLSGLGPDHYLAGNLYFFADELAAGDRIATLRKMAHWAALGRVSFWRFLFDNGVFPLLPQKARLAAASSDRRPPNWLMPELAEQCSVDCHVPVVTGFTAPAGQKFRGNIISQLAHVSACIDRGRLEEVVEMRYPFLHRPLVEFSLTLPVEALRQPFTTKRILRDAMSEILPSAVRQRRGKGSMQARVLWSLSRERLRVDELTTDSHLAEMGCINEARLQEACRATRNGKVQRTNVMTALSLETWLRVRSGRWATRNRSGDSEHIRSRKVVPHC